MASAERQAGRVAWNKGKLVGQKAPLKLKDVWAIRIRLQIEKRVRELALLDLGIDSKLRACDLVALRVRDVCHGDRVSARAIVMQRKTQRPVQFTSITKTRPSTLLRMDEKTNGRDIVSFVFSWFSLTLTCSSGYSIPRQPGCPWRIEVHMPDSKK